MALLKSCFCCSLLQGSIVTGVYTTVVYLAAFIMELCLVLEGENWVNSGRERGPLPLPAYILVVLHFTVVGLSVIMLFALYQRRVGVLLAWVFVFTLLFFPELGIVLFLVVFHWGLSNTFGIAEIAFYLVRAPINVICILCVHSLHGLWKCELSTERSLKKLSTLQMMKDTPGKSSSYKNAAYMGSTTDVSSLRSVAVGKHHQGNGSAFPCGTHHLRVLPNGDTRKSAISLSNTDMQRDHGLGRRFSTASQYSDYRSYPPKGQLPVDMMPDYRMMPTSWDPIYIQNTVADSRSEFNASLFPIHSRMGSMPILSHSRSEQTIIQPPRVPLGYDMSHVMGPAIGRYPYNSSYAQSYDFYDLGTASRSLLDPEYSLGCRRQMHQTDFSTQSLDRRRYLRRAQSFTMDPYAMQAGIPPLHYAYYGYPRHQESRSSIGAESDDFRRYRDVAL